MRYILFVAFCISLAGSAFAQQTAENVFLITLDGLRWQEVFGGAVDSMMNNRELTADRDGVWQAFQADNQEEARRKLLPWFWSTLATEGQLYGNRWAGNLVDCSNNYWFSYPGYNEILSGYSDPEVDSNQKKFNRNRTVLEWLNEQPAYRGKVAAFASWDVFPYIIHEERSGIPVNAGFRKAEDDYLTYTEQLLNDLQDEIPSPWGSVRLDAFTHHYAMEYVKKHHPKVVYIAYGETDDFAHDGRYDQYLKSAHQTDRWIAAIWAFIQQDPFYRDHTALIITTDHGRGESPMETWKSHGTSVPGAGAIWIGAIGPNIPPRGEVLDEQQLYQNQVAATVARVLGLEFTGDRQQAGAPIPAILEKQ
jgi:hypothetical protein